MLYSREAGGFYDLDQALELLRRSSDLGNAYASNNLALLLLHERETERDHREANIQEGRGICCTALFF